MIYHLIQCLQDTRRGVYRIIQRYLNAIRRGLTDPFFSFADGYQKTGLHVHIGLPLTSITNESVGD